MDRGARWATVHGVAESWTFLFVHFADALMLQTSLTTPKATPTVTWQRDVWETPFPHLTLQLGS